MRILQASRPEVGQVAFVRQRRYLVEGVTAPDNASESILVELSCLDDDAQGDPLTVLWDHELDRRVLTDAGWSAVANKGFYDPGLFAAYLRTLSWNCVTATDPNLFQSPFRAGIRLDAYQLEPLRKALRLPRGLAGKPLAGFLLRNCQTLYSHIRQIFICYPLIIPHNYIDIRRNENCTLGKIGVSGQSSRVNLFIADDVGLGKTVEAGLIVRELMLRRRVDRIVVACPPPILEQWRDEMEARFGLTFAILDRAYFSEKRRDRGFAVNPWKTHSRFIISQNLLTDETYAAGLRDWLGDFAPKSLLVLDEAHRAAPSSAARYAIDSQITQAVRDIAPRFEHRLFLSATPHNGHSNSFSALLEILDPQRFTRGVKVLTGQLDDIMVRRLKSDIRELSGGFPQRRVVQIDIDGLPADAAELTLADKLDDYRKVCERRLANALHFSRRQALWSSDNCKSGYCLPSRLLPKRLRCTAEVLRRLCKTPEQPKKFPNR